MLPEWVEAIEDIQDADPAGVTALYSGVKCGIAARHFGKALDDCFRTRNNQKGLLLHSARLNHNFTSDCRGLVGSSDKKSLRPCVARY